MQVIIYECMIEIGCCHLMNAMRTIGKDNQLEIYVLFFYEKHCVSVCVCMCQGIHCSLVMYVSGII